MNDERNVVKCTNKNVQIKLRKDEIELCDTCKGRAKYFKLKRHFGCSPFDGRLGFQFRWCRDHVISGSVPESDNRMGKVTAAYRRPRRFSDVSFCLGPRCHSVVATVRNEPFVQGRVFMSDT